MINMKNLDTIGAKIKVIMDKKLSKFKLAQSNSNVSSTNEKLFPCKICGAPIMIHHTVGSRILNMWQL